MAVSPLNASCPYRISCFVIAYGSSRYVIAAEKVSKQIRRETMTSRRFKSADINHLQQAKWWLINRPRQT